MTLSILKLQIERWRMKLLALAASGRLSPFNKFSVKRVAWIPYSEGNSVMPCGIQLRRAQRLLPSNKCHLVVCYDPSLNMSCPDFWVAAWGLHLAK